MYIIFMYLRTSNIQCACVASSAIFEKKLNGKQAQRVAGIKLELAILQYRSTLSKLENGTLDVA